MFNLITSRLGCLLMVVGGASAQDPVVDAPAPSIPEPKGTDGAHLVQSYPLYRATDGKVKLEQFQQSGLIITTKYFVLESDVGSGEAFTT